ncbi:General substrate transporter, partial [Aphelenchoides avenae]
MDVLGIVSTLAPTYASFLVIRFFQGFFFTASCVIVWVHASECVSLTRHAALSVIFGVFWVGGYCSVAVIAQFVSDWRDATILVSVPGIVLSLVLWFTVPESFHFLVEKNGRRQLEKFIERSEGKKNALDIDVKSMLVMAHEHDSDSMHSHNFRQFLDFVHANKIYVLYLVASAFIWVINFMIYMGMSMYSTYLGGNAYVNYLISGLVELPAYFAGPLLLNRFVQLLHLVSARRLCLGLDARRRLLSSTSSLQFASSCWLSSTIATETSSSRCGCSPSSAPPLHSCICSCSARKSSRQSSVTPAWAYAPSAPIWAPVSDH